MWACVRVFIFRPTGETFSHFAFWIAFVGSLLAQGQLGSRDICYAVVKSLFPLRRGVLLYIQFIHVARSNDERAAKQLARLHCSERFLPVPFFRADSCISLAVDPVFILHLLSASEKEAGQNIKSQNAVESIDHDAPLLYGRWIIRNWFSLSTNSSTTLQTVDLTPHDRIARHDTTSNVFEGN